MPNLGKVLIITGALLIAAGIIVLFAGNKINWPGHLPGDIRIERDHFRFYFPFTTMVLLSILITGILWIVRKFF